MTREEIDKMQEKAHDLVMWLRRYNPHVKVLVDSESAEFLEGQAMARYDNDSV